MANNYIKAKKFAAMVVGALARDTVFPMAFIRYDGNNFVGAEDDTITFKMPGVTAARDYEWRTRLNPIVLDKIGRTTLKISIGTHLYSAIPLTDEEKKFDLQDYASEVLTPQVEAIVRRAERRTATKLAALPFKVTDHDATPSTKPLEWALTAKGVLDQAGVPRLGRNLLLGTNAYNWLVQAEQVQQYDPSQALTAFREASFGKLAGFNIVDGGHMLGANEMYAAHPSAMVIANAAPEVPNGANWGARARFKNWSMRVIQDYDTNYARDRSFVSTFAGWSSVEDELQWDSENNPVVDDDGNPVYTPGVNVRGLKGTFTPA